MIAKKIKILIKSDGSYLDTILPPITANEDGRTIVQVIAPFPITDIVSVNYSIRPIQATVKGSYLVPTGKFGKDVLDEDYTHFQTVADWNVFEIPINAVALEYISKYRAGLVLVSFTIKQLQTPYFATNYLGLFSNTQPIPATSYNDGDYFIANEYNFTAHDITWAKGDYAYFYNGKWNKGKSVLKASTPSIELPVDPSLKDAPQLEYDEDVALLLANDLGLLTQRVSQSETDIESAENDINEIDGRVGVNETDIYNLESDVDDLETEIGNIKDGTTIVKKAEQDKSGNVIDLTYETKADADLAKVRITLLENANMVKSVAYQPLTHIITFTFFDNTTQSLDLPLESTIVSASYDNITKDITFTLQNGETLVVPLDDLVQGLASETWVTTYFIPKTALKDEFSTVPLNTNVPSEKLVKDELDKKELLENKATDFSVVDDTKYPTTKAVKDAIDEIDGHVDDIEARTTVLESKIDVIGLEYKEYGVREVVGQSASELERVTRFWGEIKLGSATGLVANVAIDDADATNSFDYIPIFKREVVDIDATDLSSNTVSNTFVKVPKFYIKEEWVTEGGTEYHYIFMSQFKHEGYRLPLPFKKPDGSERDYTFMGAYEAFLDENNKLRSLTGQIPKVTYSRNNFRIAARALDGLGINSKYQITDLAEYVDLLQIPFMIEFATKHSQGVFAGATSMAYSASHTAIADGTAVNFIVVSNATGAAFVLGQTVSIGTSNSNDSIAKDRIVTQIDVDTPNAGETTITFDGAAVNITTGHVIASRAWKTGMTDSVKVSGTHALNDGKHSIVWRGLENPFGNIWKNVDGVKISNWRGYVAENPKDYNDTASVGGVYVEPYLPLGYLNANANNYAQDLGYDANYPYAKFPISVQASSGLYFRDYYYQNTGGRTVFVGGAWNDGSGAGLFYWFLHYALGATDFVIGARLSYRP